MGIGFDHTMDVFNSFARMQFINSNLCKKCRVAIEKNFVILLTLIKRLVMILSLTNSAPPNVKK